METTEQKINLSDYTYEFEEILEAHRNCCPYHHYQKQGDNGLNYTIKCGANHEVCNDKCWYIQNFKKELESHILIKPQVNHKNFD